VFHSLDLGKKDMKINVRDDLFTDLLLSTTKPQRKQQHTKRMTAAITAMTGHTQIGTRPLSRPELGRG